MGTNRAGLTFVSLAGSYGAREERPAVPPTMHKPSELEWMFEASCRGMDADLFFPPSDGDDSLAKEICAACPVRAACLGFALENHERFGVWGGLGEKERARLSAEEREAALREATAA
jgi:WhiB family transcriptional regulator, redox-sensing transcriptional regulator